MCPLHLGVNAKTEEERQETLHLCAVIDNKPAGVHDRPAPATLNLGGSTDLLRPAVCAASTAHDSLPTVHHEFSRAWPA
jgi:hypothetical protein